MKIPKKLQANINELYAFLLNSCVNFTRQNINKDRINNFLKFMENLQG